MRTSRIAIRHILGLLLVLSGAACGARSTLLEGESEAGVLAAPVALYVDDGAGCVEEQPIATAVDVISPDETGEAIAVVDIVFAIECTGLGGDYVLGRELDGSRHFWLGGHGCEFFDGGPLGSLAAVYGVVRYRLTAGLFQIPPDVCVGFPDEEPGVQTDASTSAIAIFEQLSEAQAFAASLGNGSP